MAPIDLLLDATTTLPPAPANHGDATSCGSVATEVSPEATASAPIETSLYVLTSTAVKQQAKILKPVDDDADTLTISDSTDTALTSAAIKLDDNNNDSDILVICDQNHHHNHHNHDHQQNHTNGDEYAAEEDENISSSSLSTSSLSPLSSFDTRANLIVSHNQHNHNHHTQHQTNCSSGDDEEQDMCEEEEENRLG